MYSCSCVMFRCEDPEESYESAEEIRKKYGIKYITSPLASGTLVWAKMLGYCRLVAKLLALASLSMAKIKAMVHARAIKYLRIDPPISSEQFFKTTVFHMS